MLATTCLVGVSLSGCLRTTRRRTRSRLKLSRRQRVRAGATESAARPVFGVDALVFFEAGALAGAFAARFLRRCAARYGFLPLNFARS